MLNPDTLLGVVACPVPFSGLAGESVTLAADVDLCLPSRPSILRAVPPGTQTLKKPWASGWMFGLVPPSTVDRESDVRSQRRSQNPLSLMVAGGCHKPASR